MILGQVVNQVLGCVDLSQGELVVISVIEDVDQFSIEWMNVLDDENLILWKTQERKRIMHVWFL